MAIAILLLVLGLVFCSFVVSASVGLGGSLLMVPALALTLGPKEGVALAALLLATNNVFKIIAYRSTLPFRAAAVIIGALMIGAAVGARMLISASQLAVGVAVITAFGVTVVLEQKNLRLGRKVAGPVLALTAGATSGFSGTSGPLKGVAIRSLDLDRFHFVGAASLASFAGDATKVAIFTEAHLLDRGSLVIATLAIPLMAAGTAVGKHLNGRVTEWHFGLMFWLVIFGYTIRLITIVA